ncbi:RxLR effector protein PSR2 [Phytophthora ramorum]|uniref:RxLR effector protein PSR2 n=1 Tax=Phytophthora ramorum TaxID=164328 RepID=UPI0030B7F195|nr:RxLR effector protein PSR2 [Phytophthora ramorum]
MRVHYAVLLSAALLASAEAVTATSVSTTSGRSLSTDPRDTPVQRFLRKHEAVKTDESAEDEERGFSTGIAFLDNIIHNAGTLWDDIAQSHQLDSMLSARTNSNDAYKLLNVDKVTDNLLQSKEWKAWSTYVAMLDKSNADEAMVTSMVFQLKPDMLSKVLAEAAKNPSTKDIATRLESAQVKWWVSLSGTPDDIFKTLKLNIARSDIFESPELATFTKYLDAFNKKPRNEQTTLFEVLKNSYGDEALMKLLVSAQNAKSEEATKMMDDILAGWLDFTKSPYSLFKSLNLDKAGDDLLSSPILSTWVKYMNQFNEKLPTKKTTMIETFMKSYNDETLTKMLNAAKKVPATEQLATNLEKAKSALFNKWMVEGITPDYLFKNVMKLDPATMASSPNTNIWRSYYIAYDKAYPGKLFSFNP